MATIHSYYSFISRQLESGIIIKIISSHITQMFNYKTFNKHWQPVNKEKSTQVTTWMF